MLTPAHPKSRPPKTACYNLLYTKATKEYKDIFENFSGIFRASGLCGMGGGALLEVRDRNFTA
jgi:hypothetical protein